ncbi:MAG: T9SS type A sorting domain-containing protein [Bacteroidales bacterium]|nr:T9SS type A sorting domain-containing protein [Bacteroidales bacterium]
MKTILIILFFSISIFGNSQNYYPFPDSNAIWNHYFETGESKKSSDTSMYYSYGLMGDTIINSINYSKLYKFIDTVFTSYAEYLGGLREDTSKKVYYTGKGFWGGYFADEILLYDFSKNIGDTIEYGIWGETIILDIDSILIGQNYRKQYYIIYDCFIEGIGSIKGLLFPITDIPTKVYTFWDLVCYKQNDNVLYLNSNYNRCFPIIDNIELIDKTITENIKIYPNPVINTSVIDLSNLQADKYKIEIYNSIGINILIKSITSDSKIEIRKKDLLSGLYMYRLIRNNKIIKKGKFIVN